MTSRSNAVEESYAASEELARRRMPHLYRVARLFPDLDRYRAFCALYASMRWVDDRVDEGRTDLAGLAAWDQEIAGAQEGSPTRTDFGPALTDTFTHFDLPLDPWQKLSTSMKFDLSSARFENYAAFKTYAEGATVSPAAVFATLLLMRLENGRFLPARSYADICAAVRKAAVACYEIHILRDASRDVQEGRIYFPQDELQAFKLRDREEVDETWRAYLKSYALRIRGGWALAMAALESLEGPMAPRERLMLHLLVEVYAFSLEKIIRLNFDVWSDRHWPDSGEISLLLERMRQRYEPDVDLSELVVKVVEDV